MEITGKKYSVIYQSILSFLNDMKECFEEKGSPLNMYHYLFNKTKETNIKGIDKHIYSFSKFFKENQEAMEKTDCSLFKQNSKIYFDGVETSKAYIDVVSFFEKSKSNANAIWQHLYVISYNIDPSEEKMKQAKNIEQLRRQDATEEEIFIGGLVSKIETLTQDIDLSQNANPMSLVGKLFSSGIFNDIIGGIQTGISSGNLDIKKIIGIFTKKITEKNGSIPPEFQSTLNGILSMVSQGNLGGLLGQVSQGSQGSLEKK